MQGDCQTHRYNCICQHCGVKTSSVTPSFYYVFNISLSCENSISSFIRNLSQVLLVGNYLKHEKSRVYGAGFSIFEIYVSYRCRKPGLIDLPEKRAPAKVKHFLPVYRMSQYIVWLISRPRLPAGVCVSPQMHHLSAHVYKTSNT